MRLRPRLALATLAGSVPMVVGLVVWDQHSRRLAAEDELTTFTRHLLSSPGWRARCEAEPQTWGAEREGSGPGGDSAGPPRPPPGDRGAAPGIGRPPPPLPEWQAPGEAPFRPFPHSRPATFFAYDGELVSQNRAAPILSEAVRKRARSREALSLTSWFPDRAGPSQPLAGSVRVLVRAGNGTGPCAYILAEGTTEPWLGGILPATHVWLLPLAGVLAVVLLAAGPLVRRIRRLEMAIRRAAEAEYAREVPTFGDDEVSALARAFNEAGARARTALERARRNEGALREFVANTVHDVMIPLTVLLGHLAELQRRALDQRPPDKETVGHVMNEAHYLGALINNLAVAAKLDAGETFLQLSDVDLSALVERVVSRHKPLAAGIGVSLDHAVPARTVTVRGDVTLLEQAVGNVVYNAIRYNRAGGHVAVLLEAAATAPPTFVLSVVDDGPGMSDEELARAVERGFRGEAARTRAPGGTGLGLDIAHRVAALHALTITFSRSPYGGLQVELAGPRGQTQTSESR